MMLVPVFVRMAGAHACHALLLLLAGCATPQAPVPVSITAPSTVAQQTAEARRITGITDLAARQRVAADAAERLGDWGQALWAWDVLRALEPQNAELTRRRSLAQAQLDTGVAERMPRARAAAQRGDVETASRLFLEVLALLPGQPEASDGLRMLERDRIKRFHLGQLSRNAMMRRGTEAASSSSGGLAAPGIAGSTGGRNELEHASLLAALGENAAAISILAPLVAQTPVDQASKSLLADLYYRQAEAMPAGQRAAAITSLQRSLQLEPAHARAAARLKQLQDIKAP